MAYFALQYRILFHDTMAYGSHHYMTNLKLQNLARETILFESRVDGQSAWQEQLKDMVMLTREVYSLNLAPVGLGEKVGILLTYEDPTRSTVRLCFRIVRGDAQPVAFGFQTMILMHRVTQELVVAPPMITQYLQPGTEKSLLEALVDPSFGERAKAGGRGIKEIMSEEICEIGRQVAQAPLSQAYPKIIDAEMNEYSL